MMAEQEANEYELEAEEMVFDGIKIDELAELLKQKAKLLEALKYTHDRIHPPHEGGRPSCAMTCPALAAIAEVEAQP